MGYLIDAYLKNGKPTLEIWNREDNSKCLYWSYENSNNNTKENSNSEVQRLFRKLMLLTLKDDLSNVRVFKAD